MNLSPLTDLPEVHTATSTRVDYHGEKAVAVVATLHDGRTVEGTFTLDDKDGFGGVEFSTRKDVPALMVAKVRSVLAGTADVA